MSDTKKVLLAFGLGAVVGWGVVWVGAVSVVAWMALLGSR